MEYFKEQNIQNVIEANRAKYDATELLELEEKFGKDRVESCLLFGVLDELLPKEKAKSLPQSQIHIANQPHQNHKSSQTNTAKNLAAQTTNFKRNLTTTRTNQMPDEASVEVSFYDKVEIKKPEISSQKKPTRRKQQAKEGVSSK